MAKGPRQDRSDLLNPARLHCLILAAVSVAIWLTGAWGEFLWIDHVEIEQAGYRITNWEDFRLLWTSSLDAYAERGSGTLTAEGGYFRPVYAMLISFDWFLWGDWPIAFHLTNIAVHTLAVLALYWLGRQLMPDPAQANLVFAATLLFAVHPLGVHSVTWISGRKDSLCALFSILALLGFGKLLVPPVDDERKLKRIIIVFLSALSLNLGLLCKELAIVAPAFATIWFWTTLPARTESGTRAEMQPVQTRWAAMGLLSLFWLTSIVGFATRKWMLDGIGLNTSYPADSWLANASISCQLVCTYVVKILFPGDPTIVDRWPVSTGLEPISILAGLIVVAFVLFVVTAVLRRWMIGLLFSWFLVWMLPATGLVPLRHLYAERYLYPASWGLMLAVLYAIAPWFNRFPKPKLTFNCFAVFVACWFSLVTLVANQHWDSDSTLFAHAVKQDDQYAEGLAALSLLALEQEEYTRALELGERAIQSAQDPDYQSYWSPYGVYSNSGLAALYLNDFLRARQLFESAQSYRPNNANSSYHLGLVDQAVGRLNEATEHYQQAISIHPGHHASRVNLGHLLMARQQFGECIAVLAPTVESDPNNHLAQINIATAYLLSRQFASAESHFELAIQLVPQDPINLAKLAWSEFEQGKTSEGKAHLMQAKQLLPENPTVQFVERKYLNR